MIFLFDVLFFPLFDGPIGEFRKSAPDATQHAVVLAAVKDAAREWPEDGPSLTAAALDGTDRSQVGTEGWCRSNKRIGQDDVMPQDFPLPLPARPIVFGKRKRHYFCDHHLSLVADRDKSGFVLFCTAHHIARTKCTLTILDSLFFSCVQQFCGQLGRWKQIQNHLVS